MNSPQINELERLFTQACQDLSDSQAILKEVLDESTSIDPLDDSTTDGVHRLQLILQYRLDSQDTLAKLMQIDYGLLQILGVSPQHSSKINLERMKFALGNDDLHHILHSLSHLVHSLMLVANRYRQKQSQSALRKTSSHTKFAGKFEKAMALQSHVLSSLTEISNTLSDGNKTAEMGPVLDHISALRGPVSQFFQAIQNGMELTHDLYEKTYETVQLDNTLETLLHQAAFVLKQIAPVYQPQHFFTPAKAGTEEQLEKKASNRRLKQFFHH